MNMLRGSKVLLRRLDEGDLERCLTWVNDPEIFITMGLWGPRTAVEQREWFKSISCSRTNIIFALCLADSGEHVGNVSLFDIDYRSRNAGLTIIIPDQALQGKGLGSEAIRLLCEYAFDFLNLNKIYCKTDNPSASKLYLRLGFAQEGILREQVFRYGKYVDKYMYGLLANEFKRG
jgi:RimJ/RimL family protein N-acetyltransferase